MIKTELLKTKAKIKLPSTLDANIVESLQEAILFAMESEKPIEVDASAVSRMDTLCSQVLLSASQTSQKSGFSFNLIKASEAFENTLTLLGMRKALLTKESA